MKLKSTDDGVGDKTQKPNGNTQHDGEHDVLELNKMQMMLLAFGETLKSRNDIMEHLGLKDRMKTYYRVIKPLLVKGFLLMAYPEKSRSPLQKYHTALPTGY